jgi:predicted SnoaL-like aldol condensation-catalyzing enzyme
MWNTGEGARADELLGPTYLEHAHPDFLGPAASRALVPRVHAERPGMVVEAEIVAADGEFVAVRTQIEPKEMEGHPDGPRRGVALFRIADGKLAEQWSWDAPGEGQGGADQFPSEVPPKARPTVEEATRRMSAGVSSIKAQRERGGSVPPGAAEGSGAMR